MPRYGFNGSIVIRCTPQQADMLRLMLERQGVQPAALGRELIAAACRFLEAGGQLSFPLTVQPRDYRQPKDPAPIVPDSTEEDSALLKLIEAAKAALRARRPAPKLPNPPKSPDAARASRAKK